MANVRLEALKAYYDDILIDLGLRLGDTSDQSRRLRPYYINQLERLRKEIRKEKMK